LHTLYSLQLHARQQCYFTFTSYILRVRNVAEQASLQAFQLQKSTSCECSQELVGSSIRYTQTFASCTLSLKNFHSNITCPMSAYLCFNTGLQIRHFHIPCSHTEPASCRAVLRASRRASALARLLTPPFNCLSSRNVAALSNFSCNSDQMPVQ